MKDLVNENCFYHSYNYSKYNRQPSEFRTQDCAQSFYTGSLLFGGRKTTTVIFYTLNARQIKKNPDFRQNYKTQNVSIYRIICLKDRIKTQACR